MRYVKNSLKIFFIIWILLFSLFTSFTILNPKSNIASAIDPLVQYDSFVVLEIVNSSVLDTSIHPLEGVKNVKIKVTYFNTVPQVFKGSEFQNRLLKGLFFGFSKFVFLAPVQLTIENESIPSWCTASIAPPNIIFDAFGTDLERKVTLQIAVNKQSTALFPHTLQVKATGERPDEHIKAPPNVTLSVSLTPGYVPLISTDPGTSIKKTSPGELVNWDIKISNNGNGEALVRSKIMDIPEGWVITVNPQIIVPSLADGELNEENMSLTALPPYNFGYYNDRVMFEIELTPEFSSPGTGVSANLTKGEPIYLTLAVKLRGFSLPGFEFIFLLFGILIFIILRKHKKFIRGYIH